MPLGIGYAVPAPAQSTPPAGITIPPTAPGTLDQITPKPSPRPQPTPPPSPTAPSDRLTMPPAPPLAEPAITDDTSFPIKAIAVRGATVLKPEIDAAVTAFLAAHADGVTFEALVTLRTTITQLYLHHGYVTSGAFLPINQSLSQGIARVQVVEGSLERLEIGGLQHLRAGYVRSRLALATHPPLNRFRLEAALQLLRLDPLFTRVNAELTAGSGPGRNVLTVNLQEARPFHAGITLANSQPASVGSLQGSIFASHDNLLGWGDRLSAEYGHTEGLDLVSLSYTLPFNAHNGTLSLAYNQNRSQIIENPFRDLGIRSHSRTWSLAVRQPLVRSPHTEFALSLGLDRRRSQTFLLDDIPFSFSEGPQDGLSKVTALRFAQDWVDRRATRIFAARSQFSLGLNAFDATINDTGTDGRFFAWLGQFQWVQQLSPRAILVTQLAAQFTPDSLLSLERFSLGGVDTVRGYRENQVVADNGLLASVELRLPLTRDPKILQITPFVEWGSGWNHRGADPDPGAIASLGLGLRWQAAQDLTLRLDYGARLRAIAQPGNSLQDNGIYFSLRYQPF